MTRPLRLRRQAPIPRDTQASTSTMTKKTTKPVQAPPTKKSATTATTKVTKTTRTRSLAPEMRSSPPVAPTTRKSRSGNTAVTKTKPAAPAKKLAPKTRSSSTSSAKTTKSTRRTAPIIARSPSPIAEEEFREITPSTIIPSTPARRLYPDELEKGFSSPAQSSNAENHSPRLPSFASSPPIRQSTPKGGQQGLVIEFLSDEGYTPKKKVGSAERPRLQDLDTKTLEPIGTGDEDENDMLQLPSPTPRRRGGRPSDFLITEDEDEAGPGGTPVLPPQKISLPRPEGGKGFLVDGQEFIIYSDPRPKSLSPVEVTPRTKGGEVIQPPKSSPSPLPSRKRRSSDAAESLPLKTSPADKRRRTVKTKATRGKKAEPNQTAVPDQTAVLDQTAVPDQTAVKTSTLRGLLPKRKTTTKIWDPLEVVDNEDKPQVATTKKTTKSKSTTSAKAKATNAWTRPLTRPPAKTYTKKPLDNSANEPIELGGEEGNSKVPSSDSDPASTIEMGDGVVGKAGRKKLKELKKKFEQVDEWKLEFEIDNV